MKRNYTVSLTAYARVLVIGAESAEKAIEYAEDYISCGEFSIEEAEIAHEVKDEDLAHERRHVDAVAEEE